MQWSWGLDSNHDNGSAAADTRMRQATVNLFADMGVQPATLQPGLAPATKSTDATAPIPSSNLRCRGQPFRAGVQTLISGTATDSGGGQVWGVEVSTNGGTTWQPAVGQGNWSYRWTPAASSGSVTIKTRAVDDSGNLETPSSGSTVTVTGSGQTTIWPSNAVPGVVDQGPDSPVELGVKFYSEVGGADKGIRFYKSSANTGTHVANLWSEARRSAGLRDVCERNALWVATGRTSRRLCRSIRPSFILLPITVIRATTAQTKTTSLPLA